MFSGSDVCAASQRLRVAVLQPRCGGASWIFALDFGNRRELALAANAFVNGGTSVIGESNPSGYCGACQDVPRPWTRVSFPMPTSPLHSVLLVEDSPPMARLMFEVFQDEPTLQLHWVQTMADALTRLAAADVDLVLLDLGLPDSQGLATVTRIVQPYPTVPVIVLSMHDDDAVAEGARGAGALAYLCKGTIEPTQLIRVVQEACRAPAPRQTHSPDDGSHP